MKKLSALLLSSLVLALPACDSDDDSDTNATTDTDGTASASASASATDTDGDSASASASASASESDTSEDETGDPTDGETGDPTDTADPTGGGEAQCQYRCNGDEDCFSNGMDLGFTCVDNTFCLPVCESDTECVAQLSGWEFQPCETNDACAAGPCVDLGDGSGGCATEPTEFVDCATLMQEEVEVTDIEGNTVTVCGNTSGTCQDSGLGANTCVIEGEVTTCEDTGCPDGYTCDAASGGCLCDNDEACGDGSVCTDEGFCINPCSDASECTDALPYDGGEFVCE